ncbi:MAG TPA: CPBP family intramembrane glutamic endopeptidase [Chloroflexota bacterium]|nr:CPBP family intramembrane glutamic endopeptidase [Chloroflexota bacterium]
MAARVWLRRLLDAPAPPPARPWERASTVALVALLLGYANGDAWRYARRGRALSSETNRAHLGMLGVVLAWAACEGLGARELGLGRAGLSRGLLWGLGLGLLGAVPISLFFAFPLVSRQAVTHPEYVGVSRGRLLGLVAGQFLLGSAVFEEIAFRGLLHAKLQRLLGPGRALVAGAGVFAAWHLVITWYNLRRSNLPRALFPLLYAGALAALFAGGLLFGLIRQATGHVAGAIVAHWVMVAAIVLSVARPRARRAPPDPAAHG